MRKMFLVRVANNYACYNKLFSSELTQLLKEERERLVEALPYQFVISNIVLSVIKVVREENGRSTSGCGDLAPFDSLNVCLMLKQIS